MASHVVGERLWPPPKQLSAELTANAFICHLPKVSVTDTQDTAEVDARQRLCQAPEGIMPRPDLF